MSDSKSLTNTILNLATNQEARRREPKRRVDLSVSPSAERIYESLTKEQKISQLEEEIEKLKHSGAPISETMPVSKKEVRFSFDLVDPSLVDVSPLNKRQQHLLTMIAVRDIYDSILNEGQLEPGILRPKADGRYELIDGSRRLFCVSQIPGRRYYAKIGPIPDEDVEALSDRGNLYLPVSDYELGLSYLMLLPQFKNDSGLAKAMAQSSGDSESTIRRRLSLARLPSWIVELYPTPNDIQISKISWIVAALKDASVENALREKAEQLKQARDEAFQNEQRVLSPVTIVKELRAVVELQTKKAQAKKKPETIRNSSGKPVLKYRINEQGNYVYEIQGQTKAKMEEIHQLLVNLLV